jgi:hypothetical protein
VIYEVRASGGPTCATCGSTALIVPGRSPAALTAHVAETIEARAAATRNPLRRRKLRALAALHAETVEQLRQQTFLV